MQINRLIKSHGEYTAVCTYTVEGIDIVRTGSHSGMWRRLVNQEDRALVPVLQDIFHFHAENEETFTNVHSLARVAVIRGPQAEFRGPQAEFRGLVRILSENHIPFDIICLYVDLMECTLKEAAKGYPGLIPMSMYGPPEKCYYTGVTDIPGMIGNTCGEGKFVLVPWQVGDHYEYKGHHAHSIIVQTGPNDLLEPAYDIRVEASPMLEISYLNSDRDDYTLIGLNNLSGQVGTACHTPLPMYDINIDLNLGDGPRTVTLLRSKQTPKIRHQQEITNFTVSLLNEYEIVIVEN